MSVKTTLCSGADHHMFTDAYEEGVIFLELTPPRATEVVVEAGSPMRVMVGIDEGSFAKIVEAYLKSKGKEARRTRRGRPQRGKVNKSKTFSNSD